jgi:hypothetical protein
MCLIIEIRVNSEIIEKLVATNITPKSEGLKYGKGKQIYETKLGLIEHNFEDGALVLAEKVIKQKLDK